MNELEQFKEMMAQYEDHAYGLCAFMVCPDGFVMDYGRIIDADTLETASPGVLQFYGDDMMRSFQKLALEALPDTEPKTGENGGLQEEPNVNTHVAERLNGGPDTSEDLWESEGGGQAPNHNDVKD